ncbi:hypothetical protein PFNF54_00543 [Plasmodium falciparum NF54]|uniref:RRM domain-containing protein n=1 Tax=Plasmodium falciparum (isolate NF54) TaxID=5843 RepID=W7KAG3_PLAFO|nr:hypothetical protein PFNF54_00543 [Plasmodium falciparum NF54]
MGLFDKIRNIEKLNEAELKNIGNNDSSWHDQYRDSSYIYIGNLDNRLTEGDIVIVFSQYGEPIDVNLVRDNETGKSKGYCFLSYADQRSTILAVDNFNGYKLLERPLVVDHILNYRLPKKYLKDADKNEYKPTGAEGQGIGVYNVVESEIKLSKVFDKIKNKSNEEKKKKLLDEDELWALNFEKSIKKDIISPIGHDEKSRHNEGMKEEEEDEDDEIIITIIIIIIIIVVVVVVINKKDMEKNDIHLTSIDTISKIHARDLLKENKRKLENFQENIKHEHKDEVSLYVKKKKIKKKM